MELSINDIRELLGSNNQAAQSHPFKVGDKVFIRTVTYHLTGVVTKLYDLGMTLSDAAWIADSGRFHDALKSCNFSEVEPFIKTAFVSFAAITDATWIDNTPVNQS